jgi:predicted dehydrogenase/threonine dehydrogenase-like Zn-dependent dehydrogenase
VACAGAGIAVHAEVVCVPRLLVARIPLIGSSGAREVPFDEAAFATLGAVALHGIRTSEVRLGDLVAVVGLGLLGQLTVQLLKAAGCTVLGMDIDPSRADLARQLGADDVASSASEFRNLSLERSSGLGVDSVLITAETSSNDPVNLAGTIARDRAVVVAVGTVGMDIERKSFYEKELDFRISRSYGPGRYDSAYEQKGRDYPIGYVRWTETRNMEAFVRFLSEKKINVAPLITHRFPVERAQSAYDLIIGKTSEPFLGVVIQYSGSGDTSSTLSLESPGKITRTPVEGSLGVGMLGAGAFGTSTLIPAIKRCPNVSLISVCAASGSHAQHAARKFGFERCATDETALLQDPAIGAIVIATRHHLHARQVLAALSAGKHVFCEKPLCLTEEELRQIIRAHLTLQGSTPALMVGFNRRFASMTAKLKSFLNAVSEPLSLNYRINAGFLPPDHWVNDREIGGGRILGEVCHFVDLLMFLASSPITEVEGRTLNASERYSGDNVMVSLRFANGSAGTISYLANGDRAFSKERIEVFGGGSTAVLEDFRRLELVRNGHKQKTTSRWRQDKGHQSEWAVFADAVVHAGNVPIPFEEIVCSTLATMRVNESIAIGKPISVDAAAFIEAAQHYPDSSSH